MRHPLAKGSIVVRVQDVELYVADRGTGEPLLFVHGFPLDHSMWDASIRHLAEAGYRVLAPDLRGFGRSTGPNQPKVSMQQFADDLADLLDVLQIEDAITFCGLSMGGYIAWQFWKRHRSKLKRLVLCDTRAAADSPEAAQMRLQTAEQVLEQGPALLAASMLERLFSAYTRQNRPELVQRMRLVIQSCRPQAVAAALRGLAEREDFTSQLRRIDVPVLVVCGQHDAISPVAEMNAMAREIPHARVIVIENAGHMAPTEAPDAFHRALEQFLRETSRETSG